MARDDELPILTPDQRLRVFVSSTMEELADERTAVRHAIETLHLAPVLFELGARSHPPRSLYRAYLDQSHVFLGMYWERYGWVAPGMDVSGLEDEYLLSGDRPKLVYVKRPAPGREGRLSELLDHIRDSDEVSYKGFTTPDELERLVADDLALLLTEAFLIEPGEPRHRPTTPLPADTTSFVGRDDELAQLHALLARDDVRLVTLTGPGGIGKTRLALRAAHERASSFEEGAVYAPLASVKDAHNVNGALASALGLAGNGAEASLDIMTRDLADRSLLLVVDNCEQVVTATEVFPDLLAAAPQLKILATSREALRLRGEHEFAVPPLGGGDAVRLFDARAAAVRRDFEIDDSNAAIVASICERLEGIPLAIELAAAQARLLPPAALLERLDRRLDFLVGGAHDLPQRQQALRTTIQWSYDLLDDDERAMFAHLGIFVGTFSLAAVESVHSASGPSALDLIAALVDKSLLIAEATAVEPRFRMLEMIREFARERLDERDDAEEVGERYATFYHGVASDIGKGVRSAEQRQWLERYGHRGEGEADNLRATLLWLLDRGRVDEFTEVSWDLWVPAWIGGSIAEGRRLIDAGVAASVDLSDGSRARLLTMSGLFSLWQGDHAVAAKALEQADALGRALGDDEVVVYALVASCMLSVPASDEAEAEARAREAVARCHDLGDLWIEAAAYNALSWLYVSRGQFDEESRIVFEDTLASARAVGDEFYIAMAEVNLAESDIAQGDAGAARELLVSAAGRHRAARLLYPVGYILDAAARIAFMRGDAAEAAVLLGAADNRRAAIGIVVWGPQLERRNRLIDEVRAALGDDAFHDAVMRGTSLGYADAIDRVAAPVN